MTQRSFSIAIEIAAPPQVVWRVMADVERWPEWTPSVKRIVRLTPGPLAPGSQLRIHQPKLPPALWRVTETQPGSYFTSVSSAPGVRVIARHSVEPITSGSRVTLSLQFDGLLGGMVARLTKNLNESYLAMEANGLKARCNGMR